MRVRFAFLPLLLSLPLGACRSAGGDGAVGVVEASAPRRATEVAEPVARRVPHRLVAHDQVREDPYYWLREREDPEVIAYLHAENAYTQANMAHTEALQQRLFEELKGRVKQDDSTVPYRLGGNWYYTRVEEGEQYPIHCRRVGSLDAPEEVLLDVNAMAEGHGYYAVSNVSPSPSQTKLAYAVDDRGRRIYTIEVRDLESGAVTDRIPSVTSNLVWAEDDDRTLFYANQDPGTLRTYQIWRHRLGTDASQDVLVYEEQDTEFSCYVSKTRSRRYLTIGSRQTLATEVHVLEADRPEGVFRVFLRRRRGHEYGIDHRGAHFYVRTNWDAENFRLMRTPVDDTAQESWEEVIPHRPDVLLEGVDLFRDHMVVAERREGLRHLRVRSFADGGEHEIAFDDPVYSARASANPEFDTTVLRYGYSSLTTPPTVYDHDMLTQERTLKKRDEILGGFDPRRYVSERLWATAEDGTRVPISLVHHVGMARDGKSPLLLFGYGSYGASMDARFDADRLSLLDRGFVYAIAHVRGGQELGRQWYEDGKLLNKRNTFTDFIACAEHLVDEGYADPERLFAMGGSAGGLLMGAVVNLRPDLFEGVVAAVPFVDVVTTMLDESIPLTTFEYDEWGNPNDTIYYEYMLSYSPYDNVRRTAYPNLLVTTGLHDSQVQYWEPAKWVAKLRANRTDDNRLLLKCDMEAGHGGVSGRYRRYHHTAFVYAFLIDIAAAAQG